MERLIFHIDVNSAFLSWESARRVSQGLPDLREIPSCVGGDPKKRTGIVVAKSIPAKKYGIQTGEPVAMALRKCPNLVIVPSDFELYDKCSRAFKAICASFAPVMESFSIDEVFLDMTGTSLIYPDPVATAHELKDKIHRELGFTVNVGISTNKLLAKMASDFQKPDRVHTLFPDEIPEKMWPLPVRNLLFLGKASEQKLLNQGIRTIGDLAKEREANVQLWLGEKPGHQLCRSNIIIKSRLHTEALHLIRYCFYGRIINASGVLPKLMSWFFPQPALHIGFPFSRQITDSTDSLIQKLLLGSFSQKQQVTNRKGPHFLRNFIREQSVYSVRLLKIRCHLCQQLIGRNSHIYCKSQLSVNFIFQLISCSHRIRIDQRSTRHIQKHFINGKGFHYRRKGSTDCFKCPRTFII